MLREPALIRKPIYINGKPYVELLSYGEKSPLGHCAKSALEHFKGKEISILEIGVLRGHNAEALQKAFNPKLMVLVDPWDFCAETHDNNWMDTYYRIQGNKNTIVIKAKSEDAQKILDPALKFDYIYIDGDHIGGDLSKGTEEEGIRKDIKLWWPRVNEGGILAGHDYNYENIKHEVHRVFGDRVIASPYHPNGGMEWWVFK